MCVCVFAALNQQCSELISILDLREQRIFREMKPKYGQSRDAGVLEVRAENLEGRWLFTNSIVTFTPLINHRQQQ